MDIRKGGFEVIRKEDRSPVTLADDTSNRILMHRLSVFDFPVISEESPIAPYSERQHWEYYWCVDPLDGTKEFIHEQDEFAINVALMQNNQPIFGVLALPAKKELYYGGEQIGVFKSGFENTGPDFLNKRYEIEPETLARPFTAVVSRSHLNKQTLDHIEGMKIIHPDLQVKRAGSSTKFCLLLENKADIYPRYSPCMEWDTAAGDALIRATGKGIFQLNSTERIVYNKPNLTNPSFIARTYTR